MELDKESKRHVIITTNKGLYPYKRLCFVISSAPAIFQEIIEQILQPVNNVQPYLDDIALKNKNDQGHIQVLRHTCSTWKRSQNETSEMCFHANDNQVSWTCFRRLRSTRQTPTKSRQFLRLLNLETESNSKFFTAFRSIMGGMFQS